MLPPRAAARATCGVSNSTIAKPFRGLHTTLVSRPNRLKCWMMPRLLQDSAGTPINASVRSGANRVWRGRASWP